MFIAQNKVYAPYHQFPAYLFQYKARRTPVDPDKKYKGSGMTKGQIRKMFLEGRKVKEGRTIQVVGAVKPKSRARLTSSSRP